MPVGLGACLAMGHPVSVTVVSGSRMRDGNKEKANEFEWIGSNHSRLKVEFFPQSHLAIYTKFMGQ